MSEKKPWEYEEIVVERGMGGNRWLYAGQDLCIGVIEGEAPGGADAWASLFKASPKLVQALRAFVSDNGHTPDCGNGRLGSHNGSCSDECANARAALSLAGVPLP